MIRSCTTSLDRAAGVTEKRLGHITHTQQCKVTMIRQEMTRWHSPKQQHRVAHLRPADIECMNSFGLFTNELSVQPNVTTSLTTTKVAINSFMSSVLDHRRYTVTLLIDFSNTSVTIHSNRPTWQACRSHKAHIRTLSCCLTFACPQHIIAN